MLRTPARSVGSTCRRVWELPVMSSFRSSLFSSARSLGGEDLPSATPFSRGFQFMKANACGLNSFRGQSFGNSSSSSQQYDRLVAGDYQRFASSSGFGGHHYPFAASGAVGAAEILGSRCQQVRTIMVEVRKNDLERAIRRWRRKCKEENLRALKDREYYIKPSEKKVLARKERDHRVARKAFKQKLNWIMSRRQRYGQLTT
ncbi:hypothetical protein R1sor_019188 [Riccia sorocarpa]|uniref:Ribosomal protein S21 n=1 Tax=Riccia sorocarpa TaxID=122646 RepID=A0ABD3ICE6_9MARC